MRFRSLNLQSGRRTDLETSNRRMDITRQLRNEGLVRPARSKWGLNQRIVIDEE